MDTDGTGIIQEMRKRKFRRSRNGENQSAGNNCKYGAWI